MKANEDKYIEKFIGKIMSETPLESPSSDFTSKIMSEVAAVGLKSTTVYKPLISKTAWFIIFGGSIAFIGYFILMLNMETSHWLPKIDFSILNNNKIFTSFPEFRFSKITIYAALLSAVMLLLQITLLRKSFNRRFDL